MAVEVVCHDINGEPHTVSVDELRWRPSVYGILIRDDKILLTKQFGKYGLPGGGMNFGEQPEEGLVREFREETGLAISGFELQSVQSDLFKLPHIRNGGFVQSIQLFYRCESHEGELSTDGFDDHEQDHAEMAEWVDVTKLDVIETYGTPDFIGEIKKALRSRGVV